MRHPDNTLRPKSGFRGSRRRDEKYSRPTPPGDHHRSAAPRPRIAYHAADCVALRLVEAGRHARLRGAAGEVLGAVITLLPARWSRIRDNQVRLQQLAELCPSHPHVRTIGRALRRLEHLEILRYVPARGRGATAVITIHERFLNGVDELERDESGSVVVPFSAPPTTLFPKGKLPQPGGREPAPNAVADCRPVEVPVDRDELQTVLDHLPALFTALPRNLRWLLRCAVRAKLGRGYQPADILRTLWAPAPAVVERPFKLAMWRLSQNMIGAGPRLRVVQRRWEVSQRFAVEQQHRTALAEDYRRVQDLTTAGQRAGLLAAMQDLFGPIEDPRVAVVTAVRRARRQHPDLPAAAAVSRWLETGDQRLTTRTAAGNGTLPIPVGGLPQLLTGTGGEESCIGCGNPGRLRPELPLPTVACDDCLELAAGGDDEGLAA